ncbi:hypothetical protein C4J81_14760 [Deltaproteobacteria bacterium Smac51]|nr:hypothetical protein C4J81_14760 [Deltaproteobacteria bacterium Smac51]
MLHKFLFFMDFMGLPTGLRFEPYTYGPFSFDLANNLDFMCLSGEISFTGNNYNTITEVKDLNFCQVITDYYDRFVQSVGELSFSALECVGTLLYCVLALKKSGGGLGDGQIIEEFKKWKGDKYTDDTIRNYLARLYSAGVINHC